MSFVPMNFGFGNRTILKAYGRVALQFAPVAAPEAGLKMNEVTDPMTSGDRLDSTDLTDDLERFRDHSPTLPCLHVLRPKTLQYSHL